MGPVEDGNDNSNFVVVDDPVPGGTVTPGGDDTTTTTAALAFPVAVTAALLGHRLHLFARFIGFGLGDGAISVGIETGKALLRLRFDFAHLDEAIAIGIGAHAAITVRLGNSHGGEGEGGSDADHEKLLHKVFPFVTGGGGAADEAPYAKERSR